MAADNRHKAGRVRKAVLFSIFSLVIVLVLPLIPYAIDAYAENASQGRVESVAALEHPAIDLWNDVRQRDQAVSGLTQVKGVDAGVLINTAGEDWRRFRTEQLVPYGGLLMGFILGAILLYHALHGKTRMPGEPAGKRIPRFTVTQRTAHWFTASVFWILAITGLILLYGRFVLIPLLGAEGFSVTASASKVIHNFIGPLFFLAVLAMLVLFIKGNFYKLADIKWFAKGGGMFGGHVSAGRFNAGEKTWFWLVIVFGTAVSISGLILDFPIFGQGRELMALSHMVHGISALVLIAVSFGHIYLGTAGVEGTLDSMTTGSVDARWAQAHHDQWYDEMASAGEIFDEAEARTGEGAESAVPNPETGR